MADEVKDAGQVDTVTPAQGTTVPDTKTTAAATSVDDKTTDGTKAPETANTGDDAAKTEPKADDSGNDKAKAGNDKPDEAKKADAKAEGAPENYEKFKLPEGMEYDEGLAAKFGEFAKSQGLSQERAQQFVDYYCGLMSDRVAFERQANEKWIDEQFKAMKSDPDFGGDKYEENLALAKEGLAKFAPKELVDYCDEHWLGSYKPFVIMCRNIGKLSAEDTQPGTIPAKGGKMTEDEFAKLMFHGK